MIVVIRLSLILIVAALMMLGADAAMSLEKRRRTNGAKPRHPLVVIRCRQPECGQKLGAVIAQGWAATGVVGVIFTFIFGRKHGPE